MKNRKIIILIVFICLIIILVSASLFYNHNELNHFYKYDEMYLKLNDEAKSYYNNLKGIEYYQISAEEAKKKSVSCGLTNMEMYSYEDDIKNCFDNIGKYYIVYIEKGNVYYMHPSVVCENTDDGEICFDDMNNYDVAKFSFIKNAKNVISKVDQYHEMQFLFELKDGSLYYFTSLSDMSAGAHLVKLDLPSKLNNLSNIEKNQPTYGTDIMLTLENNKKYIIEYSYDTNKVSLVDYDEYIYNDLGNEYENGFKEIIINTKIKEKKYDGKIDINELKNELSKKSTNIMIGNPNEEDTYGFLKIDDNQVILEMTYPEIESGNATSNRYIVNSIKNPVGIYISQGIGENESFPIEYYIIDNNNSIYVVSFALRDDTITKSIYKVQ